MELLIELLWEVRESKRLAASEMSSLAKRQKIKCLEGQDSVPEWVFASKY